MTQDAVQPVDRRGFLRKLAGRGAAVAAGAAGANTLLAGPADAAEGGNIIIGTGGNANNTGTTTTTLDGSRFRVSNGNGGTSIEAAHGATDAIAILASAANGAPLRLVSDADTIPMPPTTGTWVAGSMRVDVNNDIWYCYLGGAGALSGWYPLSLVPAFIPLAAPQRIYDSRAGVPPLGVQKGKSAHNVDRQIDSTEGGFVPVTAFAVSINLIATNTVNSGWLSVREPSEPYGGASNIVWYAANQILANNAVAGTDVTGLFTVRGGGSPADYAIDALGFYTLTA